MVTWGSIPTNNDRKWSRISQNSQKSKLIFSGKEADKIASKCWAVSTSVLRQKCCRAFHSYKRAKMYRAVSVHLWDCCSIPKLLGWSLLFHLHNVVSVRNILVLHFLENNITTLYLPGISLGQAIENLYASKPIRCISFTSSWHRIRLETLVNQRSQYNWTFYYRRTLQTL